MTSSTYSSDILADHREAVDRLDTELAQSDAASRRDEIKAEIIVLYKVVDRDLVELLALKERLRVMAQRWKSLGPATEMTPPPAATADAVTAPNAHPAVESEHADAAKTPPAGRKVVSIATSHA